MQDEDGYIRQALAWANVGSEKIYSLAYATYAAYMEKMEKTVISPKSMPTISLNLIIPDGAESMKMSRCAMS